jgi:hypothetical protein
MRRSSERAAGLASAGLFLLSAAGCAAGQNSPEPAGVAERTEARESLARPLPERVEEPAANPAVGEVPTQLLDRLREDLLHRLDLDDAEVLQVVRAESVTWSDGSLGCPRPGQTYTQALVPGYWVVLEFEGREYDYRASERGYFILCDTPTRVTDPLPAESR